MPATARRRRAVGFTLIEVAVVLAVIVTLALVLTPSIANSITDARMARARNDCHTIANGIYQFFRDTGSFPAWRAAPSAAPGQAPGGANRLDVLVSQGNMPFEDAPSAWTTGRSGSLTDQLVTNAPGYPMRTPMTPFGWNGPYFSSELAADPWGRRYIVNIGAIDLSPGAVTAAGQPKSAVWVLSAGPNGIIETPFAASILTSARPGGDDIGTRIQ